ncbi:MAG: nucleotidyltransferase [Gammaproteobacteria bacterium]|nr:nucleotidyltransferase [Gammaproteobacteria bacterium]
MTNSNLLALILEKTAEALDIPEHVYEDAVLKYTDVGEHLANDESELSDYSPDVYVQGSFLLGTVVQPIDINEGYDIDLVCCLEIDKEHIAPKDLKEKVGQRLRARGDLARMLETSRRCWILKYPKERSMPKFHMDVLPSIPNEERRPTGILLTDTELRMWQKSNPRKYAEWFKKQMEISFHAVKNALAIKIRAEVDNVPDWLVKTPLQRCVQILKRHRDIYFKNDPDNKPVSIIITTLAGHAYNNEGELYNALKSITQGMSKYIEKRNGQWWVQNPVDDGENFADRWNEYPARHKAFQKWLDKLREDFTRVYVIDSTQEAINLLNTSIGEKVMSKVANDLKIPHRTSLPTTVDLEPTVPPLGDEDHVLDPSNKFPIEEISGYEVHIVGTVYRKRGSETKWALRKKSVPKKVWIKFEVKTNVPKPYTIQWQVTNTGKEAKDADGLRGDFYESDNTREQTRWESTAYWGTHWVKAFILNSEGICVAQSKKRLVKIR